MSVILLNDVREFGYHGGVFAVEHLNQVGRELFTGDGV
jgi:hypothetical protein